MVTAWDRHDGWFDDDEVYDELPRRWAEDLDPRPLEVVRRPELAFELVAPEDFEAAQTIADRLREGLPVLVDMRDCSAELRGRLTDFASGLLYALEGTLQYLGDNVMLLAPARVGVSGDEASAARRPGFYNRS